MIYDDTKFDKSGYALLGEDPGDGTDESQVLELARRVCKGGLASAPARLIYDLTIYVGNNDLTFYGITRDGLKRLGAELVRLADAPHEEG